MRRVAIFLLGLPLLASDHFEMKVRPLLAKNCLGCHTATKMGGLEISSHESLVKGGNSGPAVIEDKPDESLLLKVVRHEHPRIKMPPTGRLSEEEIETLAAWVRDGAAWPEKVMAFKPMQSDFWSLQPLKKQPPPSVRQTSWAKTPIDKFILARLEAKGIQPVAAADKRTLIRRATYDLTGLPPTFEEIQAFINDRSPQAFAKVIDRLLASPQYGERWGRSWLDVARYSDDKLNPTMDEPHPNAFRYRDWVIDAFNRDMPYDEFVKAQIAGDLMPQPERTARRSRALCTQPRVPG